MAAPGPLVFFDSFKEYMADGTFDLNTNPFKVSLHTSTFTPNVSTMTVYANLTNEVANGNGYTTGGVSLSSVTWAQTSGTSKFDAADISWTASTASWNARYGVLRATGTLNGRVDPLIGYFLLDSAPADVTFNVAVQTTIQWHANGIFTLT
jgi:hypothetical protein